jgi:serine/threonine protein kinase
MGAAGERSTAKAICRGGDCRGRARCADGGFRGATPTRARNTLVPFSPDRGGQGLQYLHSIQIIHRDVKGGNLLINFDGRIKLGPCLRGCSGRPAVELTGPP